MPPLSLELGLVQEDFEEDVILAQQSGPITLEGLPPGPPRGVGAVGDVEFFTVRLDSPLGRLLVGVDVRLVDHGFVRESVAGARRVSMRQ